MRAHGVGPLLYDYLLDHNLSAEELAGKVGLSTPTVYRVLHGREVSRRTKALIALEMGEVPSELWPPMPRKRIPGSSRRRAMAA
jgi:transcriptional regulator with XRE-family HTH domain